MGMPASSAYNATELLHLHPSNTTVTYMLYNMDCTARLNPVIWHLSRVHDTETELTLALCSSESFFQFCTYVNFHVNPKNILWYDVKVGVWYDRSELGLLNLCVLHYQFTQIFLHILAHFLTPVWLWDNLHLFSVIQCSSSYCKVYILFNSVSGDRITSRGLQSLRSQALNLCNFCLWGMSLERVHINNACTENHIRKSTQNIVFSISPAELLICSKNTLVMCDTCLQARDNHFQHLLCMWLVKI
jgi:hypothetical protein